MWIDSANIYLWPNCATPDCDAKACTVLDADCCFPCTMRIIKMNPDDGRKLIKQRREEAFGVDCDDPKPIDTQEK
jgi:hypothetical protein